MPGRTCPARTGDVTLGTCCVGERVVVPAGSMGEKTPLSPAPALRRSAPRHARTPMPMDTPPAPSPAPWHPPPTNTATPARCLQGIFHSTHVFSPVPKLLQIQAWPHLVQPT